MALGTLAIGISANTVFYTAAYHILIEPLPYPHGERLLFVDQVVDQGRADMAPTLQQLNAWRARAHSVERLTGWTGMERTLTVGNSAELAHGARIAQNASSALGVRPEIGRFFTPDDDEQGSAPVVVLGHALWRRLFGGRPDVIGRIVGLDGSPYRIIGVMPERFGESLGGLNDVRDFFIPLKNDTGLTLVDVVGALAAGATTSDANRELSLIAASVPSRLGAAEARVFPIKTETADRYRSQLLILLVAVAAVLLIACANVASLTLGRSLARRGEFAVRASLGAGRGRLVRQAMTESLIISGGGGMIGILLAWRGLALVMAVRPPWMRELANARLEPIVIVWTVAVAGLLGLLLGVMPAWLVSRGEVGGLATGATRSSVRARGKHFGPALIIAELALTATLLVSATLLLRSFMGFRSRDVGFDPGHLMAVEIGLSEARLATPTIRAVALTQLTEGIRSLPDVGGVAIASTPPPSTVTKLGELQFAARPTTRFHGSLQYDLVSPEFFTVVGIPLLAGQALSSDTAAHTAVVSEAFARKFYPSGRALGDRIRVGEGSPWLTVVGVVGNMGEHSEGADSRYAIYETTTRTHSYAWLVLRLRGRSTPSFASLTHLASSVSPAIHVRSVLDSQDLMAPENGQLQFLLRLIGAFSVFAVIISAVGLYAVVAHSVHQRTHELGVRIALGAKTEDVLRLVLKMGLGVLVVGLTLGLIGSLAVGRLLRASLYGVTVFDPVTMVLVSACLGAIALIACAVPAWRALRVDPICALRAESGC